MGSAKVNGKSKAKEMTGSGRIFLNEWSICCGCHVAMSASQREGGLERGLLSCTNICLKLMVFSWM